jgi:aspartate aminotransferase
VKLSGGVPVEVPTSVDTDFKITRTIRSSNHTKNKMMWFSSPCNQADRCTTEEELTAFSQS